jgi:hypothetical protein
MAKNKHSGGHYYSARWIIIFWLLLVLLAWQMCASYRRSAEIEQKLQNNQA